MLLDRIAAAESVAVSLATSAAPWLTPVPTAVSVAMSMEQHLAFPREVAVLSGFGIETMGIAATVAALEIWRYNAERHPDDAKAPMAVALIPPVLYFAAVTGLVFGLDAATTGVGPATIAKLAFPVLSLSSTVVLALKFSLSRLRIAAAESAEARRIEAERQAEAGQLERQQRLAERRERYAERKAAEVQAERAATVEEGLGRAAETARYFAEHPQATQAEAAEALGITPRTVRNHLAAVRKAGK